MRDHSTLLNLHCAFEAVRVNVASFWVSLLLLLLLLNLPLQLLPAALPPELDCSTPLCVVAATLASCPLAVCGSFKQCNALRSLPLLLLPAETRAIDGVRCNLACRLVRVL